jgi:hypothetical protein
MNAGFASLKLGSLLLASALAGCFTFVWTRDQRFEPLPKTALEGLEPGRTTFAECLRRLGSPLYVWEYKGDGAAIAWGFADEDSKRITMSVPLSEWFHPSVSYGDVDASLRGVVLLFDRELVLESAKEGYLRDLETQFRRTRPAPVPEPANP